MSKIVIVGGGVAAYRALHRILELDPLCDVTLISDEDRPAYERPMLSKELLTSDKPLRSLGVRGSFPNLTQLFSTRATKVDRRQKRVLLDDGCEISYEKLILATGSRPRRLEVDNPTSERLHYLRTAVDAEKLRPFLCPGNRIAIIGGGFIGLEVAASARALGAEAVVLEAQPRLLARVAPESLSTWLHDLHKKNGVDIKLGAQVDQIAEDPSTGGMIVRTASGEIPADAVLVGIGVLPNVELAVDCGLDVDGGIAVDIHGRTSDPYILAAGEATRYPLERLGLLTRSECWTTSSDQGTIVGEAALGSLGDGYREMPWVWSDQYEASIQYLGLPLTASRMVTHPGESQNAWVDIAWDDAGRFLGAIGINSGRQISELRRALRKGLPIPAKFGLETQATL
ncbi:NAD(P)/FAD-dependent oxidoreductase [Rhizobium sp. 2YAF20]|uniref:NAD(P)/FAD-dependent oxidoreductase n=1 Tax=Rhizobium sp. 2YAF20 TaxID=3233027 RepID=UPI003F9630B5